MDRYRHTALLFFTLRNMRVAQIVWYLLRRIGKWGGAAVKAPDVSQRSIGCRTGFLEPVSDQSMIAGVEFLNRECTFADAGLDWRCPEMPKLWRYHLHYFDYLLWPRVDDERKAELIDAWIAANPQGAKDAWEPYPVSLRIVNWVKLFIRPEWRDRLPRRWLASLAAQAAWLSKNLEYHILANHYLKNGKALFFAGAFFSGPAAGRWLSKGLAILRSEAREQFLGDGAHYELSPMYHNLCTEDYLDVLNLALADEGLAEAADIGLFREICRKAIEFAVATSLPDGGIPLFNDSAFGIAPDAANLADYGEALFGYRPESRGGHTLIRYSEAGVFGVRDRGTMWLVDCGPVSPAYQPGHTHCDMLSFELTLGGRRVVVDTGVHDYEDSKQRHYARSTRAHNTVAIAGHEQSELWGVFRVARRARPLRAMIEEDAEGVVFRGELRGFRSVPGGVRHQRKIEHRWSGVFTVRDTVVGVDDLTAVSCLHLHPDLEAVLNADGIRVVDEQGGRVLEVEPARGIDVSIESGWYFPEFGLERRNHVLVFSGRQTVQTLELGYTLRFATHVQG